MLWGLARLTSARQVRRIDESRFVRLVLCAAFPGRSPRCGPLPSGSGSEPSSSSWRRSSCCSPTLIEAPSGPRRRGSRCRATRRRCSMMIRFGVRSPPSLPAAFSVLHAGSSPDTTLSRTSPTPNAHCQPGDGQPAHCRTLPFRRWPTPTAIAGFLGPFRHRRRPAAISSGVGIGAGPLDHPPHLGGIWQAPSRRTCRLRGRPPGSSPRSSGRHAVERGRGQLRGVHRRHARALQEDGVDAARSERGQHGIRQSAKIFLRSSRVAPR